MSDEQLCYLPATELIRRYRAKTLSPVDSSTRPNIPASYEPGS